ncbi:MAG: amino acid adenylation domain-containing protein [Alphaproteobacteria bacterium]|nr:amino acid adenylation domain-containing protein [Alphaproteobacteria bacterium]
MTDDQLFHRLFEVQADRTPGRVALIDGDDRITYDGLDRRANRLAQAIRTAYRADHGGEMPADTLIGLSTERGIDATVGVLAILKAGGAWVPLDPAYPVDRLTYMLADAAAPIVLAQPPILARHPFLAESGRRHLLVDRSADTEVSDTRPDNVNRSDDLAYVIYTSGSTGRPKGVMCSHAAMLSRFEWMWRLYPFAEDECCSAKTSLNFVDSVWEMLGGLLKGVPTAIADNETAKDPAALLSLLRKHRVTRLIVVPALATAMVEEAKRVGAALPDLRYLTFSGEPLVSDLARGARALNDRLTILNLYGASETAADATYCEIGAGVLDDPRVPIGVPIGTMRAYVLDDGMRPVAAGEEGELFLSGPGLARGYRNLPALTAEKFLDNPFVDEEDPAADTHRRLFRTGDVVRYRPDGNLHYVGRKDFQIKIRGLRIEPGEIEAVLAEHPGVQACAVAAHETAAGDKRLVAYYVPTAGEDGARADAHGLRQFVARSVADYMVPSLFIRQDALPLLPNGKLDRRALTLPDDILSDADYVPPETETERILTTIWREVLGLSRVGTADNFFEIGGDSILAFRVAARDKEAGLELAPRDLAEAPTVAALATRALAPSRIDIETGPAAGEMPLSPMQCYYFTWAKPNPHKFNVGFIARLGQKMDVPRLRAALTAVIDHHDALRLRFRRNADGDWHQYFETAAGVYDVPVHEIPLPENGVDERLAAIGDAIDRLHDTLDIENGPVLSVGLFAGREPGEDHFFFVMHELVTDAMSLQIVLEDLRRAYDQLGAGQSVALPAKTTSYRQWVTKVMAYARGGGADAQWGYWLERGRAAIPFPEDNPSPGAVQSDIVPFAFDVLDAETVGRLKARLKGGFQTRLLDTIFTALTLTAHELSGQRNLIFHKVAHGRETAIPNADVSRTVGWFITHTPITLRLPDGPMEGPVGLKAALGAVARQTADIPDNGLGHSALRAYSDDPRVAELAHYDEVRTLFQYIGDVWEHNYDGQLFQVPDAALTDVPDTVAAENLADYRLHVYAYMMGNAFRMKFFYTRPNYRDETIGRMAALFTDAMRRLMDLE